MWISLNHVENYKLYNFFIKTVGGVFEFIIYKWMFPYPPSKRAATLRKTSGLTPRTRAWVGAPGVSSDWNDILMSSRSQWHFTRNQFTIVITSLPFRALKSEVHGHRVVVFVGQFLFSVWQHFSSETLSHFLGESLCLFGSFGMKELLQRVIFITTQIQVHVNEHTWGNWHGFILAVLSKVAENTVRRGP